MLQQSFAWDIHLRFITFPFLPVFFLVSKLSKKCCFHSISNMLNKLISNMLVSCLFTFVYCDDRR